MTIGVSALSYYLTPSLVYMKQKENPGAYHCVCSGALRSLASLPSSSTIQSLFVFIVYTVFRVLVVLSGRNRGKYLYSIFPEVEIPRGYIFIIPLVPLTVQNACTKHQALFRKQYF